MNIRSKRLFLYLLEHHIDFQDKEALTQAKKEYRKHYKQQWKKQARKNREVRPTFTDYEYQELCNRAHLLGLTPTSYIRELVLTNQENRELIPHKADLLQVLQCISMAVIQDKTNTLLIQAETLLLSYLKNN